MHSFTVNARNADACNTCCCEQLSGKPGETDKVIVNYAPWSAPIGGHGLAHDTVFSVERLGNPATPVVSNGFGRTVTGAPFNGDLAALFPNPDGDDAKFAIDPLFGPSSGEIALSADGKFVYTPSPLFTGIDRFFWNVNGDMAEFVIAVDLNAQTQQKQPAFTAPVSVAKKSVGIDSRMHILGFLLSISPAAVVGDVYRLTVKQGTRDCDGNTSFHISCFDVTIGACG